LLIDIDEPRIADGEGFLVAGLGARYTFAANEGIPNQWRRAMRSRQNSFCDARRYLSQLLT